MERSASKESGVSYLVTGIIEATNDTTLKISELPVRKWTQDYKEYLESLRVGTEKNKDAFIEVRSCIFPNQRRETRADARNFLRRITENTTLIPAYTLRSRYLLRTWHKPFRRVWLRDLS